jgi:hypothetical protein
MLFWRGVWGVGQEDWAGLGLHQVVSEGSSTSRGTGALELLQQPEMQSSAREVGRMAGGVSARVSAALGRPAELL